MNANAIWKEALCLGEHFDRHGQRLKFDRDYLRQVHANAAKMLSRGVPIPCVWEHQQVDAGSDADRLAAYAKHTFGHVAGVRFNDRGNVELALAVPDERDRQQLAKTRFVSPKLFNGFTDSAGGVYRGPVVGHLAATPTPVQFGQRPFQLSDSRTVRPVHIEHAGHTGVTGRVHLGGRAMVGPSADLGRVLARQRELARQYSGI